MKVKVFLKFRCIYSIPKDDARLLGAQSLYKKLSKNPKISHILNQMSTMNLAFIDLANKTLGSGRGFSSYKMSSRDTLKKCQDLDKVHCPTVELRVRENGIYDNIIGEFTFRLLIVYLYHPRNIPLILIHSNLQTCALGWIFIKKLFIPPIIQNMLLR